MFSLLRLCLLCRFPSPSNASRSLPPRASCLVLWESLVLGVVKSSSQFPSLRPSRIRLRSPPRADLLYLADFNFHVFYVFPRLLFYVWAKWMLMVLPLCVPIVMILLVKLSSDVFCLLFAVWFTVVTRYSPVPYCFVLSRGSPCFYITSCSLLSLLSILPNFHLSSLLPSAFWITGLVLRSVSMKLCDEVMWDILHWFQCIILRSIPVQSDNVTTVPDIASIFYDMVCCVFWWFCQALLKLADVFVLLFCFFVCVSSLT